MIGKRWTGIAGEITLADMAEPLPDPLPDDVEALKAIIAEQRVALATTLSARDAEIERLRGQVLLLLAQRRA